MRLPHRGSQGGCRATSVGRCRCQSWIFGTVPGRPAFRDEQRVPFAESAQCGLWPPKGGPSCLIQGIRYVVVTTPAPAFGLLPITRCIWRRVHGCSNEAPSCSCQWSVPTVLLRLGHYKPSTQAFGPDLWSRISGAAFPVPIACISPLPLSGRVWV